MEVAKLVRHMLAQQQTPLNLEEREKVVEQLVYEIFGLGPLEPLLKDQSISDILVNGHANVFIERNGRFEKTRVSFKNDQHLCRSSTASCPRWAAGSTTLRPWWTPD